MQSRVPPSGPSLLEYGLARPVLPRPGPRQYLSDLVVSAGLVGILVLAMSVVGKLGITFQDFHVVLPGITVALLHVHAMYARCFGWALVWIIPLLAPLLLLQVDRRWRRRLHLAAFLLVAALVLLIVLAMMIPLTHLIEGISNAGGKA